MANTHSTLSSLFSDIADSIRGKTGDSATIKADDFPSAIDAISVGPDLSNDTAVAADVRSGKTFHTKTGAATGTMANGSATTPATTITANPSISVSSAGLITASNSKTQSVTPTVSAGYVSAGTAGTITVSGSNTSQLTTKAAATITPGTTDQTIAASTYLTGAQTIKGDGNLLAANIAKDVTIFGVTGTYEGGGGQKVPHFTAVTSPVNTGSSLQKVSYCGGLFWLHCNNYLYSSPDGTTWTYRGAGGSQNIAPVTYDSGINRFVTYNGTYIRYAPGSNPSSWTNGSIASGQAALILGKCGDIWMAFQGQTAYANGTYSVNGTSFINAASVFSPNCIGRDVIFNGDTIICLGWTATYNGSCYVQTYRNPALTSGYTKATLCSFVGNTYGYGQALAYGNGVYCCVTSTGYAYRGTSVTAANSWTNAGKIASNVNLRGQFVAVGSTITAPVIPKFYYSTDASTWTEITDSGVGDGTTQGLYPNGNRCMAYDPINKKLLYAPCYSANIYVADLA